MSADSATSRIQFAGSLPAAFPVDPWVVREDGLDLAALAQTESVFALSNGHVGLRGNLDEGEPHAMPGTAARNPDRPWTNVT